MKKSMMMRSAVAMLALIAFTFSGCDFLASTLGVDKVNVPTDSFAGTIDINSSQPTLVEGSVNVGDVKLPDVFDVDKINLAPEDFTFTPNTATGALGKTAASGTITIWIFVNSIPIGPATLTITNNVVTAVSPTSLALVLNNKEALKTAINLLPTQQKQALLAGMNAVNWETMTAAQATAAFNTALKSLNFKASVFVQATGGLLGKLKLSKLQFHLDF